MSTRLSTLVPASPEASEDERAAGKMKRHEFVAFVAAVMAVNALGIDLMLPALPAIGRELAIATANQRQWIITAYVLGFGVGQLVYGPLADRFGRRPVPLATLAGFVAASVFAASAATFSALLGARMLQGLMSASTRVLSVAIVRDRFSGRRMAHTMSLAQMIFFLVPIIAPSVGQLLLSFGAWRIIFYTLVGLLPSCSSGGRRGWRRRCPRNGACRCRRRRYSGVIG